MEDSTATGVQQLSESGISSAVGGGMKGSGTNRWYHAWKVWSEERHGMSED